MAISRLYSTTNRSIVESELYELILGNNVTIFRIFCSIFLFYLHVTTASVRTLWLITVDDDIESNRKYLSIRIASI